MLTLFSVNAFIFFSVFIFAAGLILGSFLNVLILRLPSGKSVIYPPSSCPSCGAKIRFYDNIPVLSYILLAGKCRACGHKISPLYPSVELLTGILIYLLFLKYFYNAFFFYDINPSNIAFFKDYLLTLLFYFISFSVFVLILIPVFFIDFFRQIIPDSLSILLIILGFAFNIFLLKKSVLFPLEGFAAGGVFFFLIAFFYERVRKREGLGGGDVKLIAGLGAFLGLKGVIFTIFAGSVFSLIGFLVGSLFFHSYKDKKVPFGPFLSMAGVFYIFYGFHLMNLYFALIH